MEITVAAASAVEIGLLAAAGFAAARHRGLPLAEAAAYGSLGALMLVSALLQFSLLSGGGATGPVLEALAVALAGAGLFRLRVHLVRLPATVASLASAHTGLFTVLAPTALYLAARAIFLPPSAMDRLVLNRLAAIGAAGFSAFTDSSTAAGSLPPLNSAVLPMMILRYGTETGTGIFGFAAYGTLGVASYALARRYAWPPTALTVALVVWSMPRFVLHATSCGIEMVPAAAGLVAVLALYRAVESPNAEDLAILCGALCFSMGQGGYGLIFPLVLTGFALVVLLRRHGLDYWVRTLRRNLRKGSLAVPLLVLYSQVWVFAVNLTAGRPWTGNLNSPPLAPNRGGIGEALANAARYAVQALHLPSPMDRFSEILFATNFSRTLETAYNHLLAPLVEKGVNLPPLVLNGALAPETSWFGPLAALLALPALVYALIRAPRRLKALAVAMTGYAYLVALVGTWHPANARYFSPFFACSGFMVAFFLPPWRLTRRGRRLIQAVAAALLLYAAFG